MGMQICQKNKFVLCNSSLGPSGIYKSTDLFTWDCTFLPPAEKGVMSITS